MSKKHEKYGLLFGLAVLCAVLLTMNLSHEGHPFRLDPTTAYAQVPGGYDKTGTAYYGGSTAVPSTVPTLWCTVWSDTNGVIKDGTIVIVDTTTTSPTRIIVKGWPNTSLTKWKILGLAYGDIPASSTGRSGKVLIMGYHGNVKMVAGLSANLPCYPAFGLSGGMTAVADSLQNAVGWFIGYNANSTAAVRRGKCIILRPMGFSNALP